MMRAFFQIFFHHHSPRKFLLPLTSSSQAQNRQWWYITKLCPSNNWSRITRFALQVYTMILLSIKVRGFRVALLHKTHSSNLRIAWGAAYHNMSPQRDWQGTSLRSSISEEIARIKMKKLLASIYKIAYLQIRWIKRSDRTIWSEELLAGLGLANSRTLMLALLRVRRLFKISSNKVQKICLWGLRRHLELTKEREEKMWRVN